MLIAILPGFMAPDSRLPRKYSKKTSTAQIALFLKTLTILLLRYYKKFISAILLHQDSINSLNKLLDSERFGQGSLCTK